MLEGCKKDGWTGGRCEISTNTTRPPTGPTTTKPNGACVPYSEQACRDAATKMGLGTLFVYPLSGAGFGYHGCYYFKSGANCGVYCGRAFYGTGGTDAQKKKGNA